MLFAKSFRLKGCCVKSIRKCFVCGMQTARAWMIPEIFLCACGATRGSPRGVRADPDSMLVWLVRIYFNALDIIDTGYVSCCIACASMTDGRSFSYTTHAWHSISTVVPIPAPSSNLRVLATANRPPPVLLLRTTTLVSFGHR